MTTYNKYNRGSEWRKWDLHIHTPVSIYQNYGGEQQWEKFIQALENIPKEVSVIGITDYYFIDGFEKVMQYKSSGRLKNIEKIFPILEFRIDTFGSGNENNLQKINLHILFDIDESKLSSEIKKIRDEFISKIPITGLPQHSTKSLSIKNLIEAGGNLQTAFASLIPPTKDVFNLISSATWQDKTFLFLGYKEWSNLEKNNQLKPIKEDLFAKVEAFFSSNYNTIEKSQSWLNEFGNKRLLHSRDIHDFKILDTANQDDSGEFESCKEYNCNTWIKADPTFEGLKQIIYEPDERVSIQETKPEEKPSYQVIDSIILNEDKFWNNEILFNPNLNTIIGGRSTGKSTLLKCIAKKIDSTAKLSENEIDFVEDHVKGMSLKWKDGESSESRDIEFFPQSHMYEIANSSKQTDELIQEIIKEHDTGNNLSKYENFCSSNRTEIVNKINNLFTLQVDIDNQNRTLKEKGTKEGIEKEIKSLEEKVQELNSKGTLTKEDLLLFEKAVKSISLKEQKIRQLKEDIGIIQSLKTSSIVDASLEYQFNTLTEESRKEVHGIFTILTKEVNEKWINELSVRESKIAQSISKLSNDVSVLTEAELFKNGQKNLVSNKQYQDFKKRLQEERTKLNEIIEIEKGIAKITEQRNNLKSKIIELHYSYQTKVIDLMEHLALQHQGIDIKSRYFSSEEKLKEFFRGRLNLRSSERQAYVKKFSSEYAGHVKAFANDFLTKALTNSIDYKGGHLNMNVTSELLSTNWFEITFDLTYQNDLFKRMSQGKQAFVILKLLLEFSDKSCPILIDQPEDSLDNRAIYNELVKYLKDKKKERQIILVTHNPNVVVSADAEQIIVANQEGKDSPNEANAKFQYVSGGLEFTKPFDNQNKFVLKSKGIREHVCEILEGGEDAFKQRERKYSIK